MLALRKLLKLLIRIQTCAGTLENNMEFPQKVKNGATLQPSNCTTRVFTQTYRCSDPKGHMHPNVYSSNVHNSQTMERAQMSNVRWMDKEEVVCIYNGILLIHQKDEILPFAMTWN